MSQSEKSREFKIAATPPVIPQISSETAEAIAVPATDSSQNLSNFSEVTATTSGTISSRLSEVIDNRLILGFHPAYFVTVMGTGISSAILYNFPYPAHWLRICSYIMWATAIFFFLSTTIFCIIAMIKHPKKLVTFNTDPAVAPFMGAYSMGFTTLVNFLYFVTGKSWIIGIYCLWWIAVILSLYTACVIFYFALVAKNKSFPQIPTQNLHATLLLPIVTLTVVASSGGIFTPELPTNNLKMSTMVICYILWSNAIALAFIIITIYFWKLFVHKIPNTAMVFTSFLPVGVLGQGAYGIQLLGVNMHKFIQDNYADISLAQLSYMGSESMIDAHQQDLAMIIGNIILYMCTMISLFLTSFGYFCTFIAVISCLSKISPFCKCPNKNICYARETSHIIKDRFIGLVRFNKTFWALTFPLGTMALSNNELHKVFNNLKAFRVIGTMYSVSLVLITLGCLIGCFYTVAKECQYIVQGDKEVEVDVKQMV